MKVLSLFSGVGGFDLGLENAGMETVFQCEWDKHATSILQRHWPDVPRWGDITTLTGRHILDHAPVIDVVAWGSPCQDLSVAGKRAGLSGQRSGLFHEGIRIIKELRKETDNAYPRISIWENVYGALNSNKGADFGLVLDEMAEAGAMVIEWRVLDAQYFGVPQRRRRVFVVAVFDPRIAANCPDPLLPLRQGVRWNPATSRTTRQTTPRPAEESIGSSGHRMRGFGDYTDDDTASAIKARDWKDATDLVTEPPILIDRSAFNQGVNAQYDTHISDDPVTPSLVARGPHAVATSTIVQPLAFDGYNQTVGNVSQTIRADKSDGDHVGDDVSVTIRIGRDSSDCIAQPTEPTVFQPGTMTRLGGGVWEGVVPTLRAEVKRGDNEPHIAIHSFDTQFGSNANVFNNQTPPLKASQASPSVVGPTISVRRLTPLECERLMGWPDDWTAGQADTHRYKQCGNGVASPVAQWIGEQILNIPQ